MGVILLFDESQWESFLKAYNLYEFTIIPS